MKVISIFILLLVIGCNNSKNDSAAVYQAFFKDVDSGVKTLYIQDKPALLFSAIYHLSEKEKEFINDFKFTSLEVMHTSEAFGELNVYLIDNNKFEEMFSASCEEGWVKYYEQYPKAKSMIKISNVGFRNWGKEALFYIEVAAGCLAGSASLAHLKKDDGKWVLKELINLWIS